MLILCGEVPMPKKALKPKRSFPLILDDLELACFALLDAQGDIDMGDSVRVRDDSVKVELSEDDARKVLLHLKHVIQTSNAAEKAALNRTT